MEAGYDYLLLRRKLQRNVFTFPAIFLTVLGVLLIAGGGVRGGYSLGATDDFCYNIARDPVHVHDLNATILHLLGIDHRQLTFRFQGRDNRLTDVYGEVITKLLA